MWIGALILAGLVQVALDARDVLEAPTGPAFRIEELDFYSIDQYWSVFIRIGQ